MTIEAQLNYHVEMETKPCVFTYKPSDEEKRRMPRYALQDVVIGEGRALSEPLDLDRQGFVLVPLASQLSDFYDSQEVKRVYYPEVERRVREVTGAQRVFAFDHNVRNVELAKARLNEAQLPVFSPHNDYTNRSGPRRVRDLMGAEAETLLQRRFAIINVWKPIVGPVHATPLAMCDAASIAEGDLVDTDLVYRERVGEVQLLRYRPKQRWYYFSQMHSDEGILMKCYDASHDGRARFTAHTAFVDPTTPDNAPARESIEVRTLAFF